jgi:flagellar assembly protein FliH
LSNLIKVSRVNVESASVTYSVPKKDKSAAPVKEVAAPSPEDTVREAKLAAQAIVENAQVEAEDIVRRAKDDAAQILVEARMSGYKEGLEQGRVKAQLEVKQALAEVKALLERLDAEKDNLIAQTQNDIIELAFMIAEKVMNQKLSSDMDSFIKLYEKAVKDLKAQKWVKLTVSKQDVEFVTENSDLLLSMVDGAERIELEVLDDAPSGTCIVETSDKIVDAGIHTQIGMLRDAVFTA